MSRTWISCVIVYTLFMHKIEAFLSLPTRSLSNDVKLRHYGKLSMVVSPVDVISHASVISDTINGMHAASIHVMDHFHQNSFYLSDDAIAEVMPSTDVSLYSKVDKTGFIGFLADYTERVIDFSHDIFKGMGFENSYGYAIILFTVFG